MSDNIRFISTRGASGPCMFVEAMTHGLAPDGGLYLPENYPVLPDDFLNSLEQYSLQEISFRIAEPYFGTKREKELIRKVVDRALTFDAPLKHLEKNVYMLELFHGPTMAFKDFGARFMARAFANLVGHKEKDLTILVATSGDTGSAVANGFYEVEGTKVYILYPKGKVSPLQEKQMTTLGRNITAFEVEGTFDDCQKLVKQAFADEELRKKRNLSSANSINIARLLPQSFYYVYAVAQLRRFFKNHEKPVFSVPSGNFGNLTAGLIAMKMGMPVSRFLAATNLNDIIPAFLNTGNFSPRPSVKTISNAMDVGNPSNFERITTLFDGSVEKIRDHLWGAAFSDAQTRDCIKKTYRRTGYIPDPHTAVGLLAAEEYRSKTKTGDPIVVLATAHPAKFRDIVEKEIGKPIEIPPQLSACLGKEKQSISMDNSYEAFREALLT